MKTIIATLGLVAFIALMQIIGWVADIAAHAIHF
jgi:hypothetical protein